MMRRSVPGLDGWDEAVSGPQSWHVGFLQTPDLPETLLAGGRQDAFLSYFLRMGRHDAAEMAEALKAYAGAIRSYHETDSLDYVKLLDGGLTDNLGRAAVASGIPFLPGTANAGDIMRGMDLGLSHFKFFPAATSGGIPALKALAGPFGQARFCPTGGITAVTAPEWLALDAVLCVGGSWVVPAGPLDPARIETLAREASALSRH